MARNLLFGFQGKACLALACGCLFLPAGRAQETDMRAALLKLNAITGKDTIKAEVKLLLETPDKGKKLLAAALPIAREKNQPVNYNAALILAQVAQSDKDLAGCETFYRICTGEAARLQSQSMLLESYGGLVDALYENKKFAKAGRVCKEVLDLKTGDGKARIVKIPYKDAAGDTDYFDENGFDAAKLLREPFRRMYVQVLMRQGEFDQALKIVDGMIKKNDSWVELELRARILQGAGKFAEALKAYESVIARVSKEPKLDAEKREEYLERYRYSLSGLYIDMNKVDQAAEILQKLIDAKPEHPSYYNDLGYVWADANVKLEEAEKLIRKAIDLDRKVRKADPNLDPKDDHDKGAYLDSLGWVLFRQKKYKEAKEALLKAIEDTDAQHLEIYDHLGDVCLALDERAAALEYWRKGLKFADNSRRDQERKAVVEKKLEKNK